MNFKDFYTEQTWYDNLKNKTKNAASKTRNKAVNITNKAKKFTDDFKKGLDTSGTYQLGKDLGKIGLKAGKTGLKAGKLAGKVGLKAAKLGLQAIDPISDQGLLGKVSNAVKKAENWAKTGSGNPYAAASKFIKGTGGKLDIYDKKSGIEQQRAIQNYRNTYIYPRDKDTKLNQQVANLFGQSVSIDPKTGHFTGLSSTQEQKAAGIPRYSDILKRRKPITTAAHLANIVLDIFVDKFRQGVPPDKAYNDAFNSVGNPLIIDYLLKNKLLPKQ